LFGKKRKIGANFEREIEKAGWKLNRGEWGKRYIYIGEIYRTTMTGQTE
jgi:hypothetical protein